LITIAVASLAAFATAAALAAQAPAPADRPAARASGKAPASPVTGSAVRGKQLYYDYSCYACHGFNGETGARAFVPNWPANLATESSFIAVLRGRANLAPVQPSTAMPNYSPQTLSDAQARDIYAYIRTFKSNAPPADKIPTLNAILSAAQKPRK
jgi:mono/diheme cytochrome c family protein